MRLAVLFVTLLLSMPSNADNLKYLNNTDLHAAFNRYNPYEGRKRIYWGRNVRPILDELRVNGKLTAERAFRLALGGGAEISSYGNWKNVYYILDFLHTQGVTRSFQTLESGNNMHLSKIWGWRLGLYFERKFREEVYPLDY